MSHKFLQVRKISKIYEGPSGTYKQALKEVSLDLHKGEILGLLGVNGAGKTTLSSILATLHPPSSGDILWNGKSIYQQIIPYRRNVGFCAQKPNIEKSLTIEENLLFAGRLYGLSKGHAEKRKDALMDQFGLAPYQKYYEDALSGGYRQRFMIARALIHEPEIVILDEPTVGLDPHIRRQIWECIEQLKAQNITVLLTTHYLDEAEVLSDRVALIHSGTIRIIDTPHNLKKHHAKNNLEEVFLKFVGDPDALIFNSHSHHD